MADKKVEKDPRQERWEAFVEAYKKANPTKAAIKEKNGEFDKIPDSFQ